MTRETGLFFLVQGREDTSGEHNQTRRKKVSGPGGCSLKAPGRSRAAPWSRPQARNPQQPDLIHKDRTKTTNQRQPSGILNQKALAHCFMGFAGLCNPTPYWDEPHTGLFFRFVRPAGRTTSQPISLDWTSAYPDTADFQRRKPQL